MSSVSLVVPVLHASGFSWDEGLILIVAILAVPALSWFTGRFGKRQAERAAPERRRRTSQPAGDDASTDPTTVD